LTCAWDAPGSAETRTFVADLLAYLTSRAVLPRTVMEGEVHSRVRAETVRAAPSDMDQLHELALAEACLLAVDAGVLYETLGPWLGVPWKVLQGDAETHQEGVTAALAEEEGR